MAKRARGSKVKSVPSADDLALMATVTSAFRAHLAGRPYSLNLSVADLERAERLLDEHGGV